MKKLVPLLVALGIAIVASGAALSANLVLRGLVALPDGAALDAGEAPRVADRTSRPSAEPAGRQAQRSPRVMSREQYVSGIINRNIFDSSAIGRASESDGEIALSDLNVRLLATLVADPTEFSSALIAQDGSNARALGYGIGDKLEDAEIIAIEQKRVTIRRGDGSVEYLEIDAEPTRAPARPQARGAAPSAEDGIADLGGNRYAVDRSLVDQYLNDLDSVARLARAIPNRGAGGEVDGYRLSGIRRNSPLSQLGIRNGDVVHAVNGHDLSSVQEAMGAFQTLQSQANFQFEISRRGQRMTMQYEIR